MAATNANRINQSAENLQISSEDQQRINQFAKHNARVDDLNLELEMKRNELKSIQEGLDEIELFNEDEEISFLVGEVFLVHKLDRTRQLLAETKEQILKEVISIEEKVKVSKLKIDELKSLLYNRFGSNISLEGDD